MPDDKPTSPEPIRVEWLAGHDNIVSMRFPKTIDLNAFAAAVDAAHRFIASVDHTVHLLIEPQSDLPEGNMVSQFSRAMRYQPANTGKIVVVVPQGNAFAFRFIQQLAQLMVRLFPRKSHVIFARSYEEALNLLGAGRSAASSDD